MRCRARTGPVRLRSTSTPGIGGRGAPRSTRLRLRHGRATTARSAASTAGQGGLRASPASVGRALSDNGARSSSAADDACYPHSAGVIELRGGQRLCLGSPGRVPNPDSGGSISGEDEDDGIPHGESLMTAVLHPSVDERSARGRAAREQVPRSVHTGWAPAPDRPDPVALLEEQNTTREPDLVPVRHGRMLVSPFTFYRGAAKIMATDLEDTPTAGLDVQLCGDAHLSNFGAFASPERTLLFDLNDFDETLPGPFEYDVKRMAASFMIAARNNSFERSDARAATRRVDRGVSHHRWPSSPRCAPWTSGTHACRSKSS